MTTQIRAQAFIACSMFALMMAASACSIRLEEQEPVVAGYLSCEACRSDRCEPEYQTCSAVLSGESESPCQGYNACVGACAAGDPACFAGCTDAYPEADKYYSCLEQRCAAECL